MATYFKLKRNGKREENFDTNLVPHELLVSKGWTLKVDFSKEKMDDFDSEEMVEEPIEIPSVEEMQKPKRGRKPKTEKQ